ncbi:MAG: type I restriction enzyme HsdR N-terminal domain-containing protein [Bacteroidales bacterium]|jgi:hypothetical protein|nr:type I restriction enzyme HsdR N-terminal domain-containing protein [Bacteroidales bacterium]
MANSGSDEQLFCIIRRKYVSATPEERIRQNIVAYMIDNMHYPQNLISVEARVMVGKLAKRYDIVVYDRNMKVWLLVECKQSDVKLSQKVLSQILSYNMTLQAPYLLITNGISNVCISVSDRRQLTSLPQYPAKE